MPLGAQTAQHGPRTDLQVFSYANSTVLYNALKAGEIDIMYQPLTDNQYLDAIADSRILLAPAENLGLRAWSLNNNETIATYPGVRSATSYADFRKALWRLSDKVYYRDVINNGLVIDLPVPICAPSKDWWNTSVVTYVNTNLYFSVWEANALLNASGFAYGSTVNTYYNASVPGSARCIRVYPPGHPFANHNLNATVFYARKDDPKRLSASRHLRDRMLESGIPVSFLEKTFSEILTPVINARNYHIYSAAWSMGRLPTYLYSFFHTSMWYSNGPNYHVSLTSPPYPAMPTEIDARVEKVMYPLSYADAVKAAKDAQYLLVEKYVNMIPLWSGKSFYAYRNLLGVCGMRGTGPENEYTLLNAYRSDDPAKPIRAGQLTPTKLNQIYSQLYYELSSMNPFMADFMSQAPYSITTDVPRLSQDWSGSPSTWFDGAVEKSKMTYWFRDDPIDRLGDSDAEWIEPVTGNVLADFTPQWLEGGGYEFNCWYYASEPSAYVYSYYRDIHHIRVYPSEKKTEIYFNVKNFWSIYWAQGRLLYSPAWKQTPLSTLTATVFPGPIAAGTNLNLPYQTVGAPVEIKNITRSDEVPMAKASGANNNDYEMVLGRVKLYTAIPAFASITVNYWARGTSTGYAPGSLYRTDNPNVGRVWLGAGPFYVTDHISGVGGRTTYKKNPHYSLETPPLGEVDFWWYWIEGGQPRDGYYTVDNAYDVTIILNAYGSGGTGVPSSNWETGCDLALPLGLIDNNDVYMVTGASGMCWGSPPPNPPPSLSVIHDVAVTSITPSREVIPQGFTSSINVTVQNQGSSSEVFNVTAYANTTIIDTFINVALTSGNTKVLTFAWNTSGFSKGNYTISAYALPVPGEADITDNIYVDGTIEIFVHTTQYPWPMFHHDTRHTGYTESPAPNTNQTRWTYTIGNQVTFSSPAVVDGKVYIGSLDNKIYCLKALTGESIWNYTTGGYVDSSPSVVDGKVYVGSWNGKVYCLNASTGAHRWNYTTLGYVRSSPAIADGKVFVGSSGGKVYCLDALTGTHIWNYTTTSSVFSSPAIADGKVYVGAMDNNKVYCLDALTGTHIWNYTTTSSVFSSPAVANGKIIVGSQNGKVYCLNASTGAHIWNYTTGDAVLSSPAVADGKVYIGSNDFKVYCLNVTTGAHIWNYTTDIYGYVMSSPAVADGKVYVGSVDRKVYCLNVTTGDFIWSYKTGGDVRSSPAIADGVLFIGSQDGIVYAFGNVSMVPEDYPTIQQAIDAAAQGATIIVAPGTYNESLVINKPLTILGERGSNTNFTGGGTGIGLIIINTYDVNVVNVIVTNWKQGILIDNSFNCKIYSNIMYNMGDSGIVVQGSNAAGNVIHSSIIYSNNIAINLTASSTGTTVCKNTLSLNNIGLNLESSGSIVYENTISENEIGIKISDSTENTFYWNNFVNDIQILNEIPSHASIWDDGYPSGGNYWSDYKSRYPYAQEWDHSGIWNTPYVIDGYNVDNYPIIYPVHEINLTEVVPYRSVVRQGYTLKIDVTVVNHGRYTENFDLALYANTIMISKLNTYLTKGQSTKVTFTWNTIAVTYGYYMIHVEASVVPGEIDITDNTLTGDLVLVTIPGDVDGDRDVDASDLLELNSAYGSTLTDPNYNLNDDERIDASDLFILGKNYGKTF